MRNYEVSCGEADDESQKDICVGAWRRQTRIRVDLRRGSDAWPEGLAFSNVTFAL